MGQCANENNMNNEIITPVREFFESDILALGSWLLTL